MAIWRSAYPAWQTSERGVRITATALAFALLALNLLDAIVTDFALRNLGAIEVNPIMAPLAGTNAAIAVKVALPLAVMVLAATVAGPRSVMALRWTVGIYIAVVVFGLSQVALTVA